MMSFAKMFKRAVAASAFLALAVSTAVAAQAPRQTYVDKLQYPKLNPIEAPKVVRETLPNGLRLILVEDHQLPVIQMRALVRGGVIAEPADKPAMADLFGEVQRTGGVKSMTGDQVDDLLESIGASIDTSVQQSFGVVSAKMLAETLGKVLPVYAEFLMDPAFSQDKIDLAKTHLNSAISRRNDDVMSIARREFLKLMYGPQSPYARQYEYDDVDGTTREDLVAWHRRLYRPDTTILAVWGDFKTAEMKDQLAKAFAAWQAAGPAPVVAPPPIAPPKPSVNYAEKKDVEQTTVLMGQLGLRLDDPDYPAVNMLSEILGGSMSSRIFIQVRTLKGLAYGAGGFMAPAYDHVGAFYFYTATKPASTVEATQTMLEEIEKIREAPVTDEELRKAKEGYLNGYAFEFDSTDKIVSRLETYEFYGYPADFNARLRDAVEKVTKDDILRVAKKYLHPEALTILAVGNAEHFGKPLSELGTVNTIDITIPGPTPKEVIPAATPENLKAGTDLLVSAAKAAGDARLKAVKDFTTEGSNTLKTPMGELELKGKTVVVPPSRVYAEVTTPMGQMVQVLDGDKAWLKMGPQVRDLPGGASAELRMGIMADNGCMLILKDALEGKIQGQAIGKTTFEGQDAQDVLVKIEGQPVRLYLSADGKKVLGLKRRTNTAEGPADVVTVFSDWKPFDGLTLPAAAVEKVKGEVKGSSTLTSLKVNAGFDEGAFKK